MNTNVFREENGWRDIPGYEGLYKASRDGQILGLKRKLVQKQYSNKRGYRQLDLYKLSKRQKFKVHRLILLTFVGPSELDVNHLNGIKHDNRIENLEYCTRKQNVAHYYTVLGGDKIRGENHPMAKITEKQAREILLAKARGETARSIGLRYGVSKWYAGELGKYKWKHLTHQTKDEGVK